MSYAEMKPDQWIDLLEESEHVRDLKLDNYEHDVALCAGDDKDGPNKGSDDGYVRTTRSMHSRWMSWFLPQVAFREPKAEFYSDDDIEDPLAEGIEAYLERWYHETKYTEQAKRLSFQYGNRWCAGMVSLTEHPRLRPEHLPAKLREEIGDIDRVMRPSVDVFSLRDFTQDHYAHSRSEVRWQASRWRMMRSDLIQMAEETPELGWDVSKVKRMTKAMDKKALGGPTMRAQEGQELDFIWGWTIWIAEDELDSVPWMPDVNPKEDQRFTGTIITLAQIDADSEDRESGRTDVWTEVRARQPNYGPGSPYFLGGYIWPDDTPWPTSPLKQIALASRAHEAVHDVIHREASNFKQVNVVNGTQSHVLDKLDQAEHQGHLVVDGFDPDLWERIETGGITQEMLSYWQFLEADLQEVLGFDEQQAGVASADGTATAATIANNKAALRASEMVAGMYDVHRDIAWRVAWYAVHDNSVLTIAGPKVEGEEHAPIAHAPTLAPGESLEDRNFVIRSMSASSPERGAMSSKVFEVLERTAGLLGLLQQIGVQQDKIPRILRYIQDTQNLPGFASLFTGLQPPQPEVTGPGSEASGASSGGAAPRMSPLPPAQRSPQARSPLAGLQSGQQAKQEAK